ncbi:MAG TPA: amidohydrolase family protein [Roseiflexaceae bacterium]|nr:amidohydrolase family protein [Roseiflexaceae bacterium]
MTITYTAARLYTALSEAIIEHGAVTLDGNQIIYAGPAVAAPGGTTIDLGDVTLLPGLIDMHVHLTFSASDTVLEDYLSDTDELRLLRGAENARRAVLAGITTVRECGGRNAHVFALREAVQRGVLLGPRIIAAGASITTTGGHCWFFGLEADTADDLRRAVRAQVKAGADFIKVMATGGALTPHTNPVAPQYDEAVLQALVADARRMGMRVSAHCHGTEGIINAAHAGVTTIEHCSFQSDAGLIYDEATAQAVLAAGCYVCPTLAIGERAAHGDLPAGHPLVRYRHEIWPQRVANLRRLYAMGIPFVSGSDAGVTLTPIEDFAYNLTLLVDAIGLTPHAALATATTQAALALGRPDLGALAPGMAADLLAVYGNPLEDMAALLDVACVVAQGQRIR